jgi:Fic family protein
MRIPKRPPNWMAQFRNGNSDALRFLVQSEVENFVRSANDRYLHWDKLRFQQLPEGVPPELAWAAVQISRRPQRQELPISTGEGEKLAYWLPPQHQEWISIIDQQAGGYIGGPKAQHLPDDDDRYLFNSLMEEAIASSQLEGACTTREKGKELLRSGRRPRNEAERMILNNYRAILEIRDVKKEKLTPALLCHLQSVLTEGTLKKPDAEGRFRREDELIHVADVATGDVIYTPPPANAVLDRIKELCEFANTKSSPFVHPVVKAMALHFAIGFIHPFVDGNGRTARALFYWYMLKSGYWLFEYLPISRIIVAAPTKYARAYLYTETDDSDLTYFNHYHLKIVIRAIGALHHYLAAQQKQLEEAEKLLADYPQLNHRQKALIWNALKRPAERYTVNEHEGKYRVTYNTARTDLMELAEIGFLTKTKKLGGKEKVFYPALDLVKRLKQPLQRSKRRQTPPKAKSEEVRKKPPGARSVESSPSLFDIFSQTPAPEPPND